MRVGYNKQNLVTRILSLATIYCCCLVGNENLSTDLLHPIGLFVHVDVQSSINNGIIHRGISLNWR